MTMRGWNVLWVHGRRPLGGVVAPELTESLFATHARANCPCADQFDNPIRTAQRIRCPADTEGVDYRNRPSHISLLDTPRPTEVVIPEQNCVLPRMVSGMNGENDHRIRARTLRPSNCLTVNGSCYRVDVFVCGPVVAVGMHGSTFGATHVSDGFVASPIEYCAFRK